MKTKYFFLTVLAGMTFAGCTDDDIAVESPPPVAEEDVLTPISFSSSQNAFTRADFTGAEAAEKLGNQFVVSGFKGAETASPGSIVFDNYKVVYEENTANTTESNSSNWEYAGKERIKHAIDNGITQQAIKYWDYTKAQYDFFAWSTGKKTPIYTGEYSANNHEVLVTNIQPNSINKEWRAAGTGENADPARIAYTFSGTAADLSQCYISDIVTVYKGSKPSGLGDNPTYNVVYGGYQKTVTLKFRQLGTKVRIGLYETVPGYSVKNVKFYTKGGVLDPEDADADPRVPAAGQIVEDATIFSAGANIYTEGTYKVYFHTVDDPTNADNNQAHIKFAPKDGVDQATTVSWGKLNYTYRESGEKDNGAVYLGRASNDATYAGNPDENYYEIFLPNETNGNLNLRVDFTLESIDGSGEDIEVKNAKAQVPSIYTTWKPGFAYTYLFKISDNTNGRTGVYDPTQADDATINSDPAGLYPITFDAIVVDAEDGDQTQETITLVSTPSITTYQNGSKVVNNDEYTVLTPDAEKKINGHIYVTVNDNATSNDLITLNANADAVNGVALYTIPAGMTEADVVDALTYQDEDDNADIDNTILGRSGKVLTKATKVDAAADIDEANEWTLTNSVEYGVNGNAISVGTDQALRFQPAANITYAFVYTQTAATDDTEKNKDIYEAIKFANVASLKAEGKKYYRYAYTDPITTVTYTDNKGTTDDESDDVKYSDVQKGHVYFTASGDPLVYSKVNKPFIGQGATNLFTRSGAGTEESPYVYTKATTDYAVSGVTYYYTTDGQHYTEAHLVPYAENMLPGGLYEEDTTPGTFKTTTDTKPVDGKAYYYGDSHIYCVFLPQNVYGMYELNKEADKVETNEDPVEGQTYFDKYHVNDAVRYAKVIKVAAAE